VHWDKAKLSINGLTVPSTRNLKVPDAESLKLIRAKVRDRLNIPIGHQVFLSLATFEPRKRIQDIVSAFNSIKNLNTHLILVGANNSPIAEEILDLISDKSRVSIIQATKDITEYYAVADIFVFASEEETFPLVLQEAALYRIPRIVSEYSGSKELIPSEEFALLFPPRDVKKLATKMNDLLSAPKKAEEIATRAYEFQNLLVENENSQIIKTIEEVLEYQISISPLEWFNEKN
jgi:glycosyltransferase involved in cell wall biosynthesis